MRGRFPRLGVVWPVQASLNPLTLSGCEPPLKAGSESLGFSGRAPPPRVLSEPRISVLVSWTRVRSENSEYFHRQGYCCLNLQCRPLRVGHRPRLPLTFQLTSNPKISAFFSLSFKKTHLRRHCSLSSQLLVLRTSVSSNSQDLPHCLEVSVMLPSQGLVLESRRATWGVFQQ